MLCECLKIEMVLDLLIRIIDDMLIYKQSICLVVSSLVVLYSQISKFTIVCFTSPKFWTD